jgi:hypothetical protein
MMQYARHYVIFAERPGRQRYPEYTRLTFKH